MRKSIFLFFTLVFLYQISPAQESSQWLRFPAISPDGKTIAFSYHGDIYTVPSTGGRATILTISEGYDHMPVWSPDGSRITFASNRHGNFDVFVMPSKGGAAKRLTFHSSNDSPSDFSPDGNFVLFSSSRLDLHTNQQFPSSVLPDFTKYPLKEEELYKF